MSSRGLLNCLHWFTASSVPTVVDLGQVLPLAITEAVWMRFNKSQDLDLGLHPAICNYAYFIIKLFSLIHLKSISELRSLYNY